METTKTCPCPKGCENSGNCEVCTAKHAYVGTLTYCKRINIACPCPNVKCKKHGDCVKCSKNHGNKKMYCKLADGCFRKRLCDKVFKSNYIRRIFKDGTDGAVTGTTVRVNCVMNLINSKKLKDALHYVVNSKIDDEFKDMARRLLGKI